MEQARIVFFEDLNHEVDKARIAIEIASENDHQIVATESTVQGALNCLKRISTGGLRANVVVLDGNLSGSQETNGNDAAKIIHAIRESKLLVHVVGYSALPMSDYGLRVGADANKDPFRLAEILDELPEIA